MFSRNKVMLLKGIVDFLHRNADLVNYELRISHVVKPDIQLYTVSIPNHVVQLQLVKKAKLFKTEVWSLTWYEGFKEYIELPDHLCNIIVQDNLARKYKEQEAYDAEQKRQTTLFHANSCA